MQYVYKTTIEDFLDEKPQQVFLNYTREIGTDTITHYANLTAKAKYQLPIRFSIRTGSHPKSDEKANQEAVLKSCEQLKEFEIQLMLRNMKYANGIISDATISGTKTEVAV